MDLIYFLLVNNILIPMNYYYYVTPNGAKSLINHVQKKNGFQDHVYGLVVT